MEWEARNWERSSETWKKQHSKLPHKAKAEEFAQPQGQEPTQHGSRANAHFVAARTTWCAATAPGTQTKHRCKGMTGGRETATVWTNWSLLYCLWPHLLCLGSLIFFTEARGAVWGWAGWCWQHTDVLVSAKQCRAETRTVLSLCCCEGLGGTARRAEPAWSQGCSFPYRVVHGDKSWGEEDGHRGKRSVLP